MEFVNLLVQAVDTGAKTSAIIFIVLWWLERKDNRATMKDMAAHMDKLTQVLSEIKGKLS